MYSFLLGSGTELVTSCSELGISIVTTPLSGWCCSFFRSGQLILPKAHVPSVAKLEPELPNVATLVSCDGALRQFHHSFQQFIVNCINASSYCIFIRRHQKLEPSLPFPLIVTSKYSCLGFFYSPTDWKRPVWDLGSCKSYGLTSGRTDQEESLFSRTKNYEAVGSQHGSATVLCWVVLVSRIFI